MYPPCTWITSLSDSVSQLSFQADAKNSSSPNRLYFCVFCGEALTLSHLESHITSCPLHVHRREENSTVYRKSVTAIRNALSMHHLSEYATGETVRKSTSSQSEDSIVNLKGYNEMDLSSNMRNTMHSSMSLLQKKVQKKKKDRQVEEVLGTNQQSSLVVAANQKSSLFVGANEKSSLSKMEICKHCSREFNKGRCAPHEAVCKKVFGGITEGFSWKANVRQLSSSKSEIQKLKLPEIKLKLPHNKKRGSLLHNFNIHQNTLVPCPHCFRKFAPSGVQKHTEICKGVENRPKNSKKIVLRRLMASAV